MKKLSKILLALAFAMILVVPFAIVGCGNKIEEGIKIHTNFKTEYDVGEVLDLANGKITYTNEDGKKVVVALQADMISSFNTQTPGEREMIITYQGCTVLVPYTVYDVYDVEVGAYYYSAVTTQDGFPQDGFLVVKFNSKTQFAVYTVSDEQYITSGGSYYYNCTSEMVNHKCVYTCNFNPAGTGAGTGEVVYTYIITALGNDQVQITGSGSDGSQNVDKVLTKYIPQ